MNPSPQQSVSTFRDEYLQSSNLSSQINSNNANSQIIVHPFQIASEGIKNIIVKNCFVRIQKKIVKQSYWLKFQAFKRICVPLLPYQRRKITLNLIHRISLKHKTHRNPSFKQKQQVLIHLLSNMQSQRNLQLQKGICLSSSLLARKVMIHIAKGFKNVFLQSNNQVQRSHSTLNTGKAMEVIVFVKKIKKRLTKAILPIYLRTIINKNIIKTMLQLKRYSHKNQQQNIKQLNKFHKKKLIEIVERNNSQKNISKGLFQLFLFLTKKLLNYKRSALKIINNSSKNYIIVKKTSQQLKDKPQIFTNILQHLLHLSSKQAKLSKQPVILKKQTKQLIFRKMVTKYEYLSFPSSKKILFESIIQWRRINLEEKMLLKRQIEMLESIKNEFQDN